MKLTVRNRTQETVVHEFIGPSAPETNQLYLSLKQKRINKKMSKGSSVHIPVLREQVNHYICSILGPGKTVVDCTAGCGGHTEDFLATGARVIAIDRDKTALERVRNRFPHNDNLILVHDNFSNLARILRDKNLKPVNAVLADLGLSSSPQLDDPERGFSFMKAGPLDMRMDRSRGTPLSVRLAKVSEDELTRIIWMYGEEQRARHVARAILRGYDDGTITDTLRLAQAVARAVGVHTGRSRKQIHPATRTFQAIRIWLNDELGSLEALLSSIPAILAPRGRVGIISFHSLEDRMVKSAFSDLSAICLCPPDFPVCACLRQPYFARVTRKSITADKDELMENPRSRSARLRVLQRLGSPGKYYSDQNRENNDD